MEGYETIQSVKPSPIHNPMHQPRVYPSYNMPYSSDDVRIDMGAHYGSIC